MALIGNLVTIESQAAQYFGGLLQQIALVFAMVLPVARRRKGLQQPGARAAEAL
jgi:hypothetical protein